MHAFALASFDPPPARDSAGVIRFGVVAVRGAEVYELADEEGHLLNDPATQKERVSGKKLAPLETDVVRTTNQSAA